MALAVKSHMLMVVKVQVLWTLHLRQGFTYDQADVDVECLWLLKCQGEKACMTEGVHKPQITKKSCHAYGSRRSAQDEKK